MGGAVSYEPGTPVAVGKGVYDAEARDAGVCLHRAPQCRLCAILGFSVLFRVEVSGFKV
jgi:hypothetical protein